jgi:mono/diheme cytochrome c family protein
MSTLAFVLFWVVLAAALLFLAFRTTRGRAARGAIRARQLPRSWVLGFALATLIFGVVIPAAVVVSMNQRTDIPSVNVSNLTAEERHGQELFGQRCRNCHTLAAAKASAAVGPNLDELRPPKGLVLNAIEEGRSRGNGQMAADLVEGEDAEAVAAFVAKASGARTE